MRSIRDIPLVPHAWPLEHTLLLRRDPLALLRRLVRCEDLFRIQLLDRKVVVPTGPAVLQEALVEKAASLEKAFLMRYLLYPLIGEGLFSSGGALWRRQRRMMAPMFQPGLIARYAGSMVACAQREAGTWQDGATLDLLHATTRIAMSIAGRTLFGAETFSEADEIGAALTVSLRWTSSRLTTLLPIAQGALRGGLLRLAERLPGRAGALSGRLADRLHGPVLLWGAEDRRMQEAIALLDRQVQRMIDERRASGQDQPDLLGRLLAARDDDQGRMSDRQVRDEVLTLFVAGHETTATALAWTLYLLVRHPEVYRRVQAEADALSGPPGPADLPRLQTALRCFKESLRLYPPVPVFNRDVSAAMDLGGYHLPAGTVLLFCPYAIHHRPDLWPDPERFDPERFTVEAEAARPRYAFLPFSAGPRVCIGNHFALMEGPLVLATLLQQADFELLGAGAIEPEVHATLRPRGGVPVRVRLRRQRSSDAPALGAGPSAR